jgi:hypothetical protein
MGSEQPVRWTRWTTAYNGTDGILSRTRNGPTILEEEYGTVWTGTLDSSHQDSELLHQIYEK